MKKRTISLVALSLATTITLTACTGAEVVNTNNDKKDNTKESSYSITTEVNPPLVVEETKIDSLELSFMTLLDEFYKSGKSVDEILNTEDQNSVLYSSALYVKLREFGLSDETIKKESFNVVTFGLVHPSADGWKNDLLVENLNKSINYKSDAIVYY